MTFAKKTEYDVQQNIVDVLKKFVEKMVKFNDVPITEVRTNYEIVYAERKRYADIVVLKDDGRPLLIIETKKKYEREGSFRPERRFHVTSEEVLGQVFSYAAILKSEGIHVPFVATANDRQIAVFQVPEDIDKHVDWMAVRKREYGKVLKAEYVYDVLRRKYMLSHTRIMFTEGFFAGLLETLTGLYKQKYRLEDVKQELSWILIEDLRGFVDTLAPFVLEFIAPNGNYSEEWAEKLSGYAKAKGYSPTPEQLAREMVYVLLNKIIFYKVLERHYRDLKQLKPLYSSGEVRTVSEYLRKLKEEFFEKAVEVTGDFEPIFKTGVYDEIASVESEEVLKLLDWLINLVEQYKVENLGTIIGYVYEELIPAEERHQLGQFYTPGSIAELIVKWCVRNPDDRVLDPGCGSGTFLVEAYKRLAELKLRKPFNEIKYVSSDVHEQILSQLYGVDINEFPAHLSAMNLAMKNPKVPSNITNVVVHDYFLVRPDQKVFLSFRVKTARREERIELVFKGFDVVVGNPPYTRWTEIPEGTQKAILMFYRETLSRYGLTPQVARGVEPGIYVYWIVHSTKFLKENGRLGMIISDSWLQTDYGINFGRFLLDNYKIRAIIDIATRVFPVPMIGACIILAEKESDENKRMENKIVFMLLKPKESLKVDEILRLVEEYSKKDEGYYAISEEVLISVVKQKTIYERDIKWVNFIINAEYILDKLKKSPYTSCLSRFFEVSRGNVLWGYWALKHGKRPDVGGEKFFYVDDTVITRYSLGVYVKPLVSSPRKAPYFSFSLEDWNKLVKGKEKSHVFICHYPLNELPESVKEYIRWGATAPLVKPKRGNVWKPASKSVASLNRTKSRQFYDWYDLGGLIYAPIAFVRRARYWNRAIYVKDNHKNPSIALDEGAFLTLIPKVKLSEEELKALATFFNSSFTQLMSEILGIVAGGVAAGGLDAKSMENNLLILDIGKMSEDVIARLAYLFDKLDAEARRLGGADEVENVFGSELAKELTKKEKVRANIDGLFNTVIKEIDYEVGRILGFTEAEVEAVRGLVVELARRRLSRAGEARPTAIRGEERIELRKPSKARSSETVSPHRRLDEWSKKK